MALFDNALLIENCIASIVRRNETIFRFWQGPGLGWAPHCAAEILRNARLDRQVELSRMLRHWIDPPDQDPDAFLILAWANLGCLVEGSMKWFLSVYSHIYNAEPILDGRGNDIAPDELYFVRLCRFFDDHVWCDPDKARWSGYVNLVRRRRNSIHSFRDADIGSHDEFLEAVRDYDDLLDELDGRVPYPD